MVVFVVAPGSHARRDSSRTGPSAAQRETAVTPRGWLGTWSRRLGPWLVAIAIVVGLARKYEPSAVLAQMQAGSWRALMPYPFALPFGYLVLHAIWDTMVLRALARADARGVVRRVTREIAA